MLCPNCRIECENGSQYFGRTVAGLAAMVEKFPGLICPKCREFRHVAPNLARFDDAVARELVRRGVRSAEALHYLLSCLPLKKDVLGQKLGLSAEAAGRLRRETGDADAADEDLWHKVYALLTAELDWRRAELDRKIGNIKAKFGPDAIWNQDIRFAPAV